MPEGSDVGVNRFVRGMLTGGILGATVGAALILRSSYQTQERIRAKTRAAGDGARRAAQTVAHNAVRLGTVISSNTAAVARRMTRRAITEA